MGNIRAQEINHSQSAIDQSEINKTDAANAASIPALRNVVVANATAVQSNSAAIQRLESIAADLEHRLRDTRGTP